MNTRMSMRIMDCWLGLALAAFLPARLVASAQPPSPQLHIARATNSLILSWPASATDWALEQAPVLGDAASWTAPPQSTLETNSAEISLRIPHPGTNRFYRLRKLGPVTGGLKGHWRFEAGDENLTTRDTSSAPGREGVAALAFGGDAYAVIDNTNYRALPPAGAPFSASLWFRVDAMTDEWNGIIGNESDGWHLALHNATVGTNYIVFAGSGPGATLDVRGRTLLLPGQWYELAVTYDGTQGRVYLDGNLLAEGSGSLPMHAGPIHLGGRIGSFAGLAGQLDELRTYSEALTADQLALCGHWNFDENAGGLALDRSIRGHHARLAREDWTGEGRAGSGLHTSSNTALIRNDYLTLLPRTAGPFSVSLWVQPRSLPIAGRGLLSCRGSTGGWELTLQEGALAVTSTNAGGTLSLRAPANLPVGSWSKIDLTYNGAIATLYLNGRQLRQESGAIVGSRAPLMVGAAQGLANFDGAIDDLKVFRRERAASEIGPVAPVMWETVHLNGSTNLTLPGAGPAGKILTYTLLDTIVPTNGSVTPPSASGVVTYSAGARKGPDAFVYTVSDGEFTSVPATVAISVVQPHWLSPQGGSVSPLDGSSPERAWSAGSETELDAIWQTNNYYDCFYYAPGTYRSIGARYDTRRTAWPGCKHIGVGTEDPQKTVIKLVNALHPRLEDHIFAPRFYWEYCDGFEVHNMVLDCNAAGNPKYTRGAPVTLRIPLTATSRVEDLSISWFRQFSGPYDFGAAAEFKVCTRAPNGADAYVTNCLSYTASGDQERVPVNAETDEITLSFELRQPGVSFYAVSEVSLTGATVSLPKAVKEDGTDSRLQPGNPDHSILHVVDKHHGTVWISGLETNIQIRLPLDPGTILTHLNLHWYCHTTPQGLRLGPAAAYRIRARDSATGLYQDVPFARGERNPFGDEVNTFAAAITTDELVLILDAKEPTTDVYSLREITIQNDWRAIDFRVPDSERFPHGDYSALRAFDESPESAWASYTQGSVGAISGAGNNLKFTRLKVIGFGTKALRECFPMHIFNLFETPHGNVLVEDCLFAEPATNNHDGVSVLTVGGKRGSLTNAIVRRCTVRGLKDYFVFSHAFDVQHLENSLVEDCGEAVYFEPDFTFDDLGPILVRSNRFLNVHNGILLRFHAGRRFSSITMHDNEVALSYQYRGYALAACDICGPGPSGTITNVAAFNNLVRYPDWMPRAAYPEGGFLYSDIGHSVVANNVIAIGTTHSLRVRLCPLGSKPEPPQPCPPHPSLEPAQPPIDFRCLNELPAGYRRSWSNNRDLSGELLQVRFHNYGIDGAALQQQTP